MVEWTGDAISSFVPIKP